MPLQHWVKLDGRGALRQQLVRALKNDMLAGRLPASTRLPSTRALALDLGVSRTTTQAAYDQLFAEGYLEAVHGSGTFVSADLPTHRAPVTRPRRAATLSRYGQRLAVDFAYPYDAIGRLPPCRYEMLYGLPDARGFPLRTFKRLLGRRVDGARLRDLMYGDPAGHRRLRTAIADHLVRTRGLRCDREQVIVVAGAQQALALVIRLLLDPGDRAAIEDPCYLGARRALMAEGADLVPVPVDDDGLDVARLPAAAQLAYVTPSHQFPTGAVMSAPRRLALLRWAERVDAHIVEDDYDGAFRFEGAPIEALQRLDEDGRVIYLGSFSKSMIPSLRLGYAVVPHALVAPLRSAKWLADWSCPALLQDALADFLAEGHYDRHLRAARARLASRRQALLAAVDAHFGDRVEVQGTGAGLHVLLWLNHVRPKHLDRFIAAARQAGVGVYSALPYFASPPIRAGILVGYALLGERQLDSAIKRLAQIS